MKKPLFISLVLFTNMAFAQKTEIPDTVVIDGEVFNLVDEDPEFPGGMDSLHLFLTEKLNPPVTKKKDRKRGVVHTSFVVTKDGTIGEVEILKGISKIYDDEVIRVIKLMPTWKPGVLRGKPVNVRYQLPIQFF